jgi:hypothetical protein
MLGPRRPDKSRLARRLTTLLPALTLAEAIETTRLHSVAGLTGARTALVTTRPCRAPHHPLSEAGLIGIGGCRGRGRCRGPTTASCCWMSGRSSVAMASTCCVNRSSTASRIYHFPGVIELTALATLAARIYAPRGTRR